MLVAIQFPHNLMIAGLMNIEKINLVPRLQRAALAVNRIEMPVNLGTKVERLVSEQIKLMATNAIRLLHDSIGFAGQMLAQERGAMRKVVIVFAEKESRTSSRLRASTIFPRLQANAVKSQIKTLGPLLA